MDTITATELARDTRRILDRVAEQGVALDIQRHQTTVARLVPAARTMTAAQTLAGLQPTRYPGHGATWARNRRSGFGQGVRDPWA